ncbi:MAG: hypothetical protein V4633_13345 [Pseudomonadota bacterium]
MNTLQETTGELPDIEPTDLEIIDLMVEDFGMTHLQAIERLSRIDFNAVRAELP